MWVQTDHAARLGQIIRTARNRARLTIPAAAQKAGVSAEWLGDIERGKSRHRDAPPEPTPATLAAIADAAALDEAERDELAKLRPDAAPELAAVRTGEEADLDALIGELVAASPLADPLGRLWSAAGRHGIPLGRDNRVELMLAVLGAGGSGADTLVGALLPGHPLESLLLMLWELPDGEGRLRDRADRVELMLGVLRPPAKPAASRRTG